MSKEELAAFDDCDSKGNKNYSYKMINYKFYDDDAESGTSADITSLIENVGYTKKSAGSGVQQENCCTLLMHFSGRRLLLLAVRKTSIPTLRYDNRKKQLQLSTLLQCHI